MTLLEKLVEEVRGATIESEVVADDMRGRAARRAVEGVLRAMLSPTQAQVNRMGAKALAGPQPVVGQTIYPAEIWKAGVLYILEEQDREPKAEPETEEQADG